MWPDLMKRETLAKRLDVEPGMIDCLINYCPTARAADRALKELSCEKDSSQ